MAEWAMRRMGDAATMPLTGGAKNSARPWFC